MNQQELWHHLDDLNCTIDHVADGKYIAENNHSGGRVILEKYDYYSVPQITHYCLLLKISFPKECRDKCENYLKVRETKSKYIQGLN